MSDQHRRTRSQISSFVVKLWWFVSIVRMGCIRMDASRTKPIHFELKTEKPNHLFIIIVWKHAWLSSCDSHYFGSKSYAKQSDGGYLYTSIQCYYVTLLFSSVPDIEKSLQRHRTSPKNMNQCENVNRNEAFGAGAQCTHFTSLYSHSQHWARRYPRACECENIAIIIAFYVYQRALPPSVCARKKWRALVVWICTLYERRRLRWRRPNACVYILTSAFCIWCIYVLRLFISLSMEMKENDTFLRAYLPTSHNPLHCERCCRAQ